MAKYRLDVKPSYDFALIGISCREKDYRLGWALNHVGEFRFERSEDFMPDEKTPDEVFPRFEFYDEEHYRTYVLVANLFRSMVVFPEMNGIDYLLLIIGDNETLDVENVLERIHRIDFVILASELDIMKIKNRETLLLLA